MQLIVDTNDQLKQIISGDYSAWTFNAIFVRGT